MDKHHRNLKRRTERVINVVDNMYSDFWQLRRKIDTSNTLRIKTELASPVRMPPWEIKPIHLSWWYTK
jgi:hypothetical protein